MHRSCWRCTLLVASEERRWKVWFCEKSVHDVCSSERTYKSIGVSCEGKRQMREIVDVYLRLVCACAHNPVSILAHTDTLAGFLKLEILQQIHAVCEFGVVLQTALSFPDKPLWKRARLAATDGVDRYVARGNLHVGAVGSFATGSGNEEVRDESIKVGPQTCMHRPPHYKGRSRDRPGLRKGPRGAPLACRAAGSVCSLTSHCSCVLFRRRRRVSPGFSITFTTRTVG